MTTEGRPSLKPRWFYAFEDGWQTFSDKDDARLEERWKTLSDSGVLEKVRRERREREEEEEEQRKALDKEKQGEEQSEQQQEGSSTGGISISWPPSGVDTIRTALFGSLGKGIDVAQLKSQSKPAEDDKAKAKGKDDKKVVSFSLDPDEPQEERETKIEVMEDHLFDVDVATMELFPVFWKGVLLRVVRAHWFYMSSDGGFAPIPFDEGLSSDLDDAYEKVSPWKEDQGSQFAEASAESKDEASPANSPAKAVYVELPSMPNNGRIQFESSTSGRIFTENISGKLLSVLGGSLVIRGWEETAKKSERIRNTSIFNSSILPWAGGQKPNNGEKNRLDASENAKDKGHKTMGSQNVRRRQGAAQVPDKPKEGDTSGEAGVSKVEEEEQNQGWLGKLWPSTDGSMKPKVNLLQSIGWSKEDATKEGQRSARQENTEQALRTENKDEDGKEDEADVTENEDEGGAEANEREKKELNERAEEPPELVLCIHGIGQKLVDDFEALDFVYDVERLRNLSKSCASDAALKKISKGKRAQFLPVCWRKDLSFDDEEALEGNDNVYGLRDITNDSTIPMVRTVISKLILDVPYYLSRHKETMTDAVVKEVNRIYRLFVRRNPDFEEKGGRVSLICHSLGSSLAADILSAQPTIVPSLKGQDVQALQESKHFVFNTRNLFFVGSPNGFFFHLHGAQMIARRGTARTKDVAADAASDEVGRIGCLAAESVYNCFNATDPVAFLLSATVDREYARMLRPISIPDAVPALMQALAEPKLSLSKYFEVAHPFAKPPPAARTPSAAKHPGSAVAEEEGVHLSGQNSPLREVGKAHHRSSSMDEIGRPVLVEQGSQQKIHQISSKMEENKRKKAFKGEEEGFDLKRLQRAERRFRALNPHGCIDFIYASGGMNEYFDMLSAHVSYWSSKTFSMFVLTQLLSDFAHDDLAPTIVPRLAQAKTHGSKEGDTEGKAEEAKRD